MKAKVIRGVYIRGKPYPEGAIVEVNPIEFAELKSTNYVVAAPAEPARPAAGEFALDQTSKTAETPARRRAG
jgi:hypothetical protein